MGIPGLQRLDHVGFTVPDLAAAHSWLVDVLGCEYMYRLGPFRHDDSDWMTEHLNVHPRAVMEELHFFRLGGQAVFEVFQYAAPDQRAETEAVVDRSLAQPMTMPAGCLVAIRGRVRSNAASNGSGM